MSRSCLPVKIQEKILLRLPVKSILRFKSVCKKWYALLSSRKFIKDHINLANKNQLRNRKFMMRVSDESEEANDIFYSIDYASILSPTSCKFDGAVVMNYPNDNNAVPDSICHWIMGSCNGLILLFSYYSNTLFLWNPSTREYKEIEEARSDEETHLSYGLGYDAKKDNYKLVCVATGNVDYAGEFDDFSEVYVYTDGSWRRGQDIPYAYTGADPAGVLLNGALHWLVEASHSSGNNTTHTKTTIISFDISSENFMELPLPKEIMTYPKENTYGLRLKVLGDSLCLISSIPHVRVDVWVMQNYGAEESWTKQFSTTQQTITDVNTDMLKLYRSLKNGEILIEDGERFSFYDGKNDSVRIPNINDMEVAGDLSSASYVESLVALNSGTYMGTMEENQLKYASQILVSHLKKNSEVTMKVAADEEAKRKHNELTESSSISSKRRRTSDENQ